MLLWQLSRILVHYFGFNVVESWQSPTFPDITVCNICPLIHQSAFSLQCIPYVKDIVEIFNDPELVVRIESVGNLTADGLSTLDR